MAMLRKTDRQVAYGASWQAEASAGGWLKWGEHSACHLVRSAFDVSVNCPWIHMTTTPTPSVEQQQQR